MEFMFKHFWAALIAVNIANAAVWWFRGQKTRAAHPDRAESYKRIVWFWFAGAGSIPWLTIGAGVISGELNWMLSVMDLRTPGIFCILFFVSLFGLLAAFVYYVWLKGGAEELALHPGLLRYPKLSASPLYWKLFAVFLPLWNAIFFVILWTQRETLGPFISTGVF